MATTTHDDGFREIQLNGKQLVFLFMAVTVVSVVIFLCGVLVGRDVGRGEAGVSAGATDVADLAANADEAPPPAAAPGNSDAPVTSNETLTYADRLGSSNPTPEKLRRADAAAPKETSAPAAPAAAPTAPPPAPRAAAVQSAPSEPGGPGFAIQVAALRERSEADSIANRLIGKGYQAYVMAPPAGSPAVFRVRVGKFKEKRDADGVAARLQKEEQFKPWIVR